MPSTPALRSGNEEWQPMARIENQVARNASRKTGSRNGFARRTQAGGMSLFLPLLGFLGLGAGLVGYAAVGVLLAVLLLAILTLPLAIAFQRFAPERYARMQASRPVW
jgi:hypothetical protein